MRLFLVIFAVEALAASWIEIQSIISESHNVLSKPLRLRGLKSDNCYHRLLQVCVEALAASWIEI